MRRTRCWLFFGGLILSIGVSSSANAQQVTLGYPFHSMGDSFYEHFGIGFNFRQASPNGYFFFTSGNSNSALPFFGGFNPAAGSTFGMGGQNGNASWGLNLSAAQGYSSNSVTTTPMFTVPNGGFGTLTNATFRPFVTSVVPVVNGEPRPLDLPHELMFSQAASEYIKDRLEREKLEADELEQARKESNARLKYRRPKPEDPPLVLGRGSPASK